MYGGFTAPNISISIDHEFKSLSRQFVSVKNTICLDM